MKKEKKIIESARLLDESTPFAIKEAFNQLRTNIMYFPNDMGGCPVYGITSAEMGVGKSTISANIALSFAGIGKKVLLVDADMRRPAQAKLFGIDKSHIGFSELLSEIESEPSNAMISPAKNLTLITAGSIPPDPSALMLGKHIGELIAKWREEFDIIFIDLPPVGLVTDPLTICGQVNGYIMVVTVNKSEAKHVNDTIDQIKRSGAKLVGVVVNGTLAKDVDYRSKSKYEYYDSITKKED